MDAESFNLNLVKQKWNKMKKYTQAHLTWNKYCNMIESLKRFLLLFKSVKHLT